MTVRSVGNPDHCGRHRGGRQAARATAEGHGGLRPGRGIMAIIRWGGNAMPSPFPGMDPYLEAPDIWPDVHDALAGEIRALLNQTLPAPYYARLEKRPEVGIVEEEEAPRRIVPDVAAARRPPATESEGGIAVLEAPRAAVSRSMAVTVQVAPPSPPIRRDPRPVPRPPTRHPD